MGRRRDVGGFDPVRALTDAQRQAIETAESSFRLFTRFLGAGGNGHENGSRGPRDDDADDQLGFGELRRSVTRSFDLYLELAERFFDSSTRSLENALRARGVTVTGVREQAPWTPVQPQAEPGRRAATAVWLHNSTDGPLMDVSFRPTDLTSYGGAVISAAAVTLTPVAIEFVPAGESIRADLAIDVNAETAIGIYAGYVLVAPVAEAVLPVLLHVTAAAENGDDTR
jgi:hypothetical protein